ncbi:MAG: beta-ketoacyl-ACP synthase II [Elusimicrobia bacterium]|nr:beta-ketoacyl-ACP synthase II [Elusimicrobiota bacterium]
MSMNKKRIVVTGLGVVSPIGIGKAAFLESIKNGRSGVGRVSYFDVSTYPCQIDAEVKGFDAERFMDKKKIKRMDPFAQFALAAARLAVEDAAIDFTKENVERCGVIVGSGIGGLQTIETEHSVILAKGMRRVSPFLIPMLISNIASGEIAIEFGLTGPNYSVSSACATANHALGAALRHLRYGDADVLLAGGAEAAITALGYAGFCQARALTTDFNDRPEKACRPFDKNRSGFIMGEGAGVLVLETLEHAQARGAHIYGELAGFGATDDAYHITAPSPEGKAASRAMQLAMEDAGVRPEEVDYINAHGTSTELNDKTETLALKKVFGAHAKKLAVSSTKSMTGHLLGAAGAVELIATLLCMENGFIHPTVNYETPDPECDLDYVPNVARTAQIQCALSNSLGFGGHNAVVVAKRFDA